MRKQHYLLSEVARIVGVRGHRIQYAIGSGFLEDVAERINDKRLFTPEDVARVKAYFAGKKNEAIGRGRPMKEAHE